MSLAGYDLIWFGFDLKNNFNNFNVHFVHIDGIYASDATFDS